MNCITGNVIQISEHGKRDEATELPVFDLSSLTPDDYVKPCLGCKNDVRLNAFDARDMKSGALVAIYCMQCVCTGKVPDYYRG